MLRVNVSTLYYHSPLQTTLETWGDSHLAIACGTVPGDNITAHLLFCPQ